MGVVRPKRIPEGLEELCRENEALLIFDEVITDSGWLMEGAEEIWRETGSHLSGEIIGGGMPVGAYGGRARSWEDRPLGPVYSRDPIGKPLAMTAGWQPLRAAGKRGL